MAQACRRSLGSMLQGMEAVGKSSQQHPLWIREELQANVPSICSTGTRKVGESRHCDYRLESDGSKAENYKALCLSQCSTANTYKLSLHQTVSDTNPKRCKRLAHLTRAKVTMKIINACIVALLTCVVHASPLKPTTTITITLPEITVYPSRPTPPSVGA